MNHRRHSFALSLGLLLAACGGSVVEGGGDAGEAGAAGGAGKGSVGGAAGAGGQGGWVGTGGGTAGAAAQGGWVGTGGVAGAGAQGGWAGSGGGVAGGGGGVAGAGGNPCPPLPSCNWCGGSPYYDPYGCVAGWLCANGVDPCKTQPCWSQGCPAGTICASDGLCWPGEPVITCSEKFCSNTPNGCMCKWSCSNGSTYNTDCKLYGSSLSCECTEYTGSSASSMGCGTAGGSGGGPISCSDSCCGFPQ